jgi:hypothetical protein
MYSCDLRLPEYYVQRRPTALAQCRNFSNCYNHIFIYFSNYYLAIVLAMAYVTTLLGRLDDARECRKLPRNGLDAQSNLRQGYNDTNGRYTNL